MKTGLKLLTMLCLTIAMTSSIFFAQQVAANGRETERVTFSESVRVGGALLEADTYKLVWEGAGPQVQVSFMKGSKTAATASATLVSSESSYDGAIETKTVGDTKVLAKITWKKKALVFEASS